MCTYMYIYTYVCIYKVFPSMLIMISIRGINYFITCMRDSPLSYWSEMPKKLLKQDKSLLFPFIGPLRGSYVPIPENIMNF